MNPFRTHAPTRNLALLALAAAAVVLLAMQIGSFGTAGAAGVSFYVSPTGNDSASGTASAPFRTVQRGASVAQSGDYVNIAPGTYAPFSIDHSGHAGAPITFRRNGNGQVWLDGQCSSENVVTITGDFITMQDIGARRAGSEVIRLESSDNAVFERMTVTDWNCGEGEDQYRGAISSWGGGRNLTIRGSYMERRVQVAGDDTGYGNGIWVKNTGPDAGGGHVFEDNTIVGGWDGIGGEPEDYTWGVFNKNTTIQRNNISGCSDDGIQVEGGNQNNVVAYNTISRCLIGVAMAPSLTGPLTVMRNVITDSQPWRGEGPAMFKVGDNSVAEIRIYHNSYYSGTSVPSDGFKQTNENMQNLHLLNNAIYVGRYAFETYTHTGQMSADYDALWSLDPERFVKWEDQWYSNLSAARGIGLETHGISTSNFGWDSALRPQSGSPLIDKGVRIPGINDSYTGSAPDIGAFEFGGSNPTPAPTQAPPPPPAPTQTPTPRPATPPPVTPRPATATPVRTAVATPVRTPVPTVVTDRPTRTPPVPAVGRALFSGDVNCDGWVTTDDGVRLLAIASGNRDFGQCTHIADLNCDGALTSADALAILTYVTTTSGRLPGGCVLDPAALP